VTRATTVRFTDEMSARLDEASARTGMPMNSIVVAACLEWMQRHTPRSQPQVAPVGTAPTDPPAAPRWATIRRAVEEVVGGTRLMKSYPFERFTASAQNMLTAAQAEALNTGFRYIGTEHLLLAAFADPASRAARILGSLNVAEPTIRITLERLLSQSSPRRPKIGALSWAKIVPTSRVRFVIDLAFKLRDAAGDQRVGTDHILFALAAEGEGIAAHVLLDGGVTTDRIGTVMGELTEPEA